MSLPSQLVHSEVSTPPGRQVDDPRTRTREWAPVLVGAALGALLSLPLLTYHFAWDQGNFATIADALLRGKVAYRDAWELHPPGVFYVYYSAFLLLGRNEWSARVFEVVAVALTSGALVRFSMRRLSSAAAGLVASGVLPLLYLYFGHGCTAEPESYQMPFVLWAWALWPRGDERTGLASRTLGCGLLLGAAAMFTTPVLFNFLMLAVDRVRMDRRLPSLAERMKLTVLLGASFALIPILTAGYYFLRGALPQLVEAVFVFGPRHAWELERSWSPAYHAGQLWKGVEWLLPLSGRLLVGCGVLRALVCARSKMGFLGILGIAAVAQIVVQMRYLPEHFQPLTPLIALGFGVALLGWGTGQPPSNESTRMATAAVRWGLALLLLIGVTQLFARVLPAYGDLVRGPDQRIFHQDGRCEKYWRDSAWLSQGIRNVTDPKDRIFLWANNPLPYFLSHRPMAGPYSFIYPVTAPWLGSDRVHQLVDRLDFEAPKLIVIGSDDALWIPGDARAQLESHAEMREFLRERYRSLTGCGNYEFWFRNPE